MGHIELETQWYPWSRVLNQYHLFDDELTALHFTHISDQRAVGHCPFYVFGIYLIEKREPDHSAK